MDFKCNDTFCFRLRCCFVFLFLYSVQGKGQLTADFATDKPGGCAPLVISFTNQTTGASANAVYSWDFENGNTSALLNPGATFKNERVYNITLTVQDGANSSVKTKQVTVASPPVADFTASIQKGCAPLQADFTASPADGSLGYTWDFGDGNIQEGAGATQSHIYSVAQKATVSLTVSNSYGCTKTILKQNLVNILPALQPAFSASQTTICRVTDPVQFTNTSTGPGTLTYTWNFGDSKTSTLESPSHIFNTRGTYAVSLTATNTEGCIVTSTQNGDINVANFTSDFSVPPLLCRGSAISFTNTSSPQPSLLRWVVDGGIWPYDNANSIDYTFDRAGSHTIELQNSFGNCADVVSKKIIINDIPDLQGFVADNTSKCGAPALVKFKDTTRGDVKWEWDFTHDYGDQVESTLQSPTYTYNGDGGYEVFLRVANAAGCTATAAEYIGIARPYVSITAEGDATACSSITKKFSATSSDSIVVYRWDFGDNTSSPEATPSHLFNTPGIYAVNLFYTTLLGCTGAVSYGNLTVYKKPVANFAATATTICGNAVISFKADNQGQNILYSWELGDNTTTIYAFENNAIDHQYTYDSIYSIRLIVTNSQNLCSDTLLKTNYIKILPPFSRITSYTNTCDGTRGQVKFTQAATKALQLVWDFGDGTTLTTDSTKKEITHLYTKSGQYLVKLKAINGQCSVGDSTYTPVLLKQSPVLSADKTDVCANDVVQVKITHYDLNPLLDLVSPNYSMSYFYSDNTPFTGIVKTDDYYYLWSNEFIGSLSQFDKAKKDIRVVTTSYGFGCSDTSNFVPLSTRGSLAGFQILSDSSCFKLPVLLKDTSKTNSKIKSWQWDFGDNTSETLDHGGTISHAYANPGQYNIVLTITDTSGCASNSNAQFQPVVVNGPKADFAPSPASSFIKLPVYFNNNTNNFNSDQTLYSWTFGDGATSRDFAPTHTYTQPGQYTVKLIARNPVTGCADTATQLLSISNFNSEFSVTNSFLSTSNCPPVLVRLSNNSVNYTSVRWDFGDGTTADNLNYPAHVYDKPGKYIIRLFVYGPGGLTGTYLDSVIIQQPVASLRVDKKTGCIGLVSTLFASIKNSSEYTWDFGDGTLTSSSDSVISHQYINAGIYQPLLILKDPNGCNTFSSLANSIVVQKNPVITITPAAPLICRGQSIILTATGGNSYTWSPAKGLSSIQSTAPDARPDSTTVYTVTGENAIGCPGTGNIEVTVVQKTTLKLATDTALCLGNTVKLVASGMDNFKWIFNTIGLSDTGIPDPVANPLVSANYTVMGSDANHCFADTASIHIKVFDLPVVSINPVQDILPGSPVQLTSITSTDVVQWTWSPSDYLSCINCAAPVSNPLAAINYKLTVKNNNGCTASANVQLKVQCEESRVFIPAAFSPNNDGTNDIFAIKGISVVKHMIIYSRWGKPVYERSNYVAADRSTGWDGNYRGELLPAGAYTYFAEMECPSGGRFIKKGTVILIR